MNNRQLLLKDDPSEYIIYHPYPCQALPLQILDIPDDGYQIVSIDPGIKHFAIRIERRFRTGFVETIYMNKFDFTEYGETSERTGTTKVNPAILSTATSVLQQLLPYMYETRLIAIERQMGLNYKSSRIFQHVLTFYLLHVPNFKYPCIITDIWPKLKGKMMGAPKGLNKNGLKTWSIEKALQILSWRNDQAAINIIKSHRGKSKTKADDLADTVVQIEGLSKLLGGPITPEPHSICL